MKILIKNGFVVDPASGANGVADVLIEDSAITRVAKNITETAQTTIDAAGKIVMPGLVDMHVHLREPGREDKETVASGTAAAVKGGVTTVLSMPNTMPAIDSVEQVRLLEKIIARTARANVLVACAITKGRKGEELVDMASLKAAGARAFTDDGASVDSEPLMRQALIKARENACLIICHCEDRSLAPQGVINLGVMSTVLGLRGIPKEAEFKRVARDLALAKETGAALHIAHVSCRESVELIALAKKQGVRVTAETAPQYFSLTEEALGGYDTNLKMNPPLRTREDIVALKTALKDGVIDVIASDHAPHTDNEKEIEFDRAEFGTTGLETELALGVTELVEAGVLDWPGLVQKMAVNPAKILGIKKGTLAPGADADVIVVDPKKEWTVTREGFVSLSRNSAFIGRSLRGAVETTVYAGKVVSQNAKVPSH